MIKEHKSTVAIYSFGSPIEPTASKLADQYPIDIKEHLHIRSYDIVYEIVQDIQNLYDGVFTEVQDVNINEMEAEVAQRQLREPK